MNESEKIKYNQGFVDGYKKATEQANAVIEDIKAEINGWMKRPACYIPNWDAYKRVLELIDRHMKGERY